MPASQLTAADRGEGKAFSVDDEVTSETIWRWCWQCVNLLPTGISPHGGEWAQGREFGNMSRGNENCRLRVAICRLLAELTGWTLFQLLGC